MNKPKWNKTKKLLKGETPKCLNAWWMQECMNERLNEWMGGQMDGWTHEWTNEWKAIMGEYTIKDWNKKKTIKIKWTLKWMNAWLNECLHACINECIEWQMAEGMTHNERNKWMQICMKEWVAEWLKKNFVNNSSDSYMIQ
jgi:hypothetical protein